MMDYGDGRLSYMAIQSLIRNGEIRKERRLKSNMKNLEAR